MRDNCKRSFQHSCLGMDESEFSEYGEEEDEKLREIQQQRPRMRESFQHRDLEHLPDYRMDFVVGNNRYCCCYCYCVGDGEEP